MNEKTLDSIKKRLNGGMSKDDAVKAAKTLLTAYTKATRKLEQAEQFMVEVTDADRLYVVHQGVWKRKVGNRWYRSEPPTSSTAIVQSTARQTP